MRVRHILAIVAVGAAAPVTALGQSTVTSTFDVTITITDTCRIVSTSPIAFATQGVINANVDASGAIAVECTTGTPYDIDLNAGLGAGATTAVRRMTGLTDTSVTVDYTIYQDASRTVLWGDGGGSGDGVASTGTGATQTFTTYGRVPPVQSVLPQSYRDTVTVTVTY